MGNNTEMLPFFKKDTIEIGMDESGRGPMIGNVFAAAVIWDSKLTKEIDPFVAKIRDSKKVSKKQRPLIRDYIEKNAIDFAVCFADNNEIDTHNIMQATFMAMHRCLDKINTKFDFIIVDGNTFKPYFDLKSQNYIPHECIVEGDNKYIAIAAASILAKVYHDEYITNLCKDNADMQLDTKYNLLNCMGYGTKKHFEGIKTYGITQFHRKSFLKKIF